MTYWILQLVGMEILGLLASKRTYVEILGKDSVLIEVNVEFNFKCINLRDLLTRKKKSVNFHTFGPDPPPLKSVKLNKIFFSHTLTETYFGKRNFLCRFAWFRTWKKKIKKVWKWPNFVLTHPPSPSVKFHTFFF